MFHIEKVKDAPFNRAQGVTFRMICYTLERASRGEKILFLSPNRNDKYYIYNKVVSMCRCYFTIRFVKSGNSTQDDIIFPNGGKICFRVEDKYNKERFFRGVKWDDVVRDTY